MKRILYLTIISLLFAASCTDEADLGYLPNEGQSGRDVIAPSVMHAWTAEMPYTRSLVDNLTTQALEANFLRLDEDVDGENGLYTYLGLNNNADPEEAAAYEGKMNWEKAKIVEASVISSPDRDGRRSVFLNPVQGYAMSVKTENAQKITTYYHTRMVSWYPRTCDLVKDPVTGMATDYVFDVYNNSMKSQDADKYKYVTADANGKRDVEIRFTGLNGEKDVMVSDVVEAQMWHKDGDDGVICGSSDGGYSGVHRVPFGHNDADPAYENIMTYKHYLSAIRVNAYPADASEQTIGLWGKINKVVVANQPTECFVTLPSTVDPVSGKSSQYGTARFGEPDGNFNLVRTAMFGPDPNNDEHYVADDASTLEGYTSSDPMKLGYALIAPDRGVVLDVHTDAGIYRVTIPPSMEIGEEGNKKEVSLFEAGKIYDVVLEFKTSNTIAALLLNDDGKKYWDLTAGRNYDISNTDQTYFEYKHSNCYVIYPGLGDGNYDGFCFDATVVGNGNEGILPGFDRTTAEIDPVSAGLIWESSYGLVQQVEFMYGYVRFRVRDYETRTGNAVIGVFDKEGNILWSWHIWITGSEPQMVTVNLGSAEVGVMDRNLGALSEPGIPGSTEAALGSYGLYYQWGRKDPSVGPPTYDYLPMSTATSDYYDGYGDLQQSTGVINIARPEISDGVENPMYLILPTEWPSYYQFDWLFDRKDNLWGEQTGMAVKTIYDPCPEGYAVPRDEINLIFANGTKTGNTYGVSVNDGALFFPYAGYKGVDRGMSSLTSAWKYVGKKGDYMSAKVLSSNHRSRTYVTSAGSWGETGADGGTAYYWAPGKYVTDGTNRRTAGSVRCVKDKSTLGSIHMNVFFDFDYYFEGESIGGTVEALANGFDIEGLDLEHAFADSDEWSDLQIEDDGFSLTVPKLEKNNSMVFKLTAGLSGFNEEIDFEKTFITSVYDYYNPDKNYEADNLLDGRFYTFTIKESNLRLTLDNDGKTVIIEEKDFAKESDLYDYMFVIEGLSPTSQHGNYNNKATCKIKHYLSGKYLKRVSDQAGGVQLTENPAEATVFYLCSDWSTENSSFVDILDESGNYLYATDYRNVWFNKAYANKSYKWQINRIKTPVASIGIELDQDKYEVDSNFSGTYSASVSGYDDESVFIQYAMSAEYPGDADSAWDSEATVSGGSFSISVPSASSSSDRLWVRLKVKWDNDTEAVYSVCDVLEPPISLNINLGTGPYFPGLPVSGTYNTDPVGIDVTLQYAVSDTEPTSWTDADSAEIAAGSFSFTAPSLQTDSSKLWVRLKYGSVYSTAVSADIHKYANPKYIVEGGCYIFVLDGGARMLAYDPDSKSIIMTDFSETYQNNYHYIQVVGFGDATPYSPYNTCKKGKLKVYAVNDNNYITSEFILDSEDNAPEFNFYTDWGYDAGTELTVDLYVDGKYLQAGSTATTPHFGTIDYDTYKWRLIPVPTPNAQ